MLTAREQAFVLAFVGEAAGNQAKAAELAGYAKGSAKVTACRLMQKANVKAAIANRAANLTRQSIADAAERREILTAIARSKDSEHRDVAKAIDVLNKMDGLYIQKVEHSGNVDIVHRLAQGRARVSQARQAHA